MKPVPLFSLCATLSLLPSAFIAAAPRPPAPTASWMWSGIYVYRGLPFPKSSPSPIFYTLRLSGKGNVWRGRFEEKQFFSANDSLTYSNDFVTARSHGNRLDVFFERLGKADTAKYSRFKKGDHLFSLIRLPDGQLETRWRLILVQDQGRQPGRYLRRVSQREYQTLLPNDAKDRQRESF